MAGVTPTALRGSPAQPVPARRVVPAGSQPGSGPNLNAARRIASIDADRHLARVERLADLLDSRFRVPGLGWRFGLDGLLGLLPGIGDGLSFAAAAGIVGYAATLGVRPGVLLRMAGNVAIDFVVGSIPLVGDIFDFAFKANRRNAALLRRELTG